MLQSTKHVLELNHSLGGRQEEGDTRRGLSDPYLSNISQEQRLITLCCKETYAQSKSTLARQWFLQSTTPDWPAQRDREVTWVFILMWVATASFSHWLGFNLTILHDWLVLKELVQKKQRQKGKEWSQKSLES